MFRITRDPSTGSFLQCLAKKRGHTGGRVGGELPGTSGRNFSSSVPQNRYFRPTESTPGKIWSMGK